MKKYLKIILGVFLVVPMFANLIVAQTKTDAEKAEEFFKLGETKSRTFEQRLADYSKSIELQPRNDKYYLGRGNLAIDLNKEYLTISDMIQAIKINPNVAEYYALLGSGYAKQANYDSWAKKPSYTSTQPTVDYNKTIELYTKAIKLDPKVYSYYWGRSNYYFLGKKFDLAIQDYTKVVELFPQSVLPFQDRAKCYAMMGKVDEALKDLSKIIEMRPNEYYHRYYRGSYYFEIKRYAEAIKDFTKAIELEGNRESQFFYARGEAEFQLGDYQAAIADSTEAIKLDEKYLQAYIVRANAYEKIGKTDLAQKDREKAISMRRVEVCHQDGEKLICKFEDNEGRD
jgi:tetratricopeptide (TPR) repeat protein